MRGMILAAGRGERMGNLTLHTPKPLLKFAGRYLIEYAIEALIQSGIEQIVINICYHGEQIQTALGNGSRYGAVFYYSKETEALETGGGIFQALPLLGDAPFIVLSADVVTDYNLQKLPREPQGLAHLMLVENPLYHPRGDFCLRDGHIYNNGNDEKNNLTFGNVGVYRPELFTESQAGKFRLGDLLKKAIALNQVTGELYHGVWHNVGTPNDLVPSAVLGNHP